MGLYSNQVLPRVLAVGMGTKDFARRRAQFLQGVEGRVLELGFGAGLNLPHYPERVEEVLALEPARVNRRLAAKRIAQSPIPMQWIDLKGESIPLPNNAVDTVTSSWTLCTIPHLEQAFKEVRRVLKPGGQLSFIEHGLAPDESVRRWQRRLNPLQGFCFGGCKLDLAIDALIEEAGFEIQSLHTEYAPGPKVQSFLYRGTAQNPI